MSDQNGLVSLGLLIGIAAAQLLILWLCCLWCAASPASRCCCPDRKNIYAEGVIIQAGNMGQPYCNLANASFHPQSAIP